MPKLAIRRGETLDREIDLADRDLRIGRGDQNDVVLSDQTKAVSRFHAELRHENGRYVLIDLNSQNGIWVGGRRQQKITLEPGVPVVLGTYTLVLEGAAARSGETLASGSAVGSAPGDAGASKPSDTLVQGAEKRPTAAPPARAKVAPPARPTGAKPGQQGSAPGLIAYLARLPRPVLFGGFAFVIILIMALGQIFSPADKSPVSREVTESVPPPPPPPPPDPLPPLLADARAALERKDFDTALQTIDKALAIDSTNAEALELRTKANDLKGQPGSTGGGDTGQTGQPTTDAPGAGHTGTGAPPVPPTTGGPGRGPKGPLPPPGPVPIVTRRQNESVADWYARDREMSGRYERAKAAVDAGSFQSAIALLSEIQRDEPDYKDVPALLTRVRDGLHALFQQALDLAAKSESDGDWPAAVQQYEHAQQVDPSSAVSIEESLRRLRGRMKTEGIAAFTRAKQYDAVGRIPEAVALYERAYRYLPADDPNRATAKSRLDALRARQ